MCSKVNNGYRLRENVDHFISITMYRWAGRASGNSNTLGSIGEARIGNYQHLATKV